jgi:simple sugar transport system permease protein
MSLISVTFKVTGNQRDRIDDVWGRAFHSVVKTLLNGTVLSVDGFKDIRIPVLADIPYVGEALFDHNMMVYIAYLLVPISSVILYKTTLGLKIRSVGQNPKRRHPRRFRR